MKADSTKAASTADQEPIGIVISRGPRNEHVPTFFAYIWGPDPEAPEDSGSPRAA